ncbi:hypothetical protein M419DRAFT_123695 [Trichoderma reesei RUT C-30]|uniref:Uncharacterized protein n=1 Tax=Hypocrea jecorina (strain ATCC 56765 / BCRC 32924 / NRRL 11460 / Rut C-30) TaxID=1344414 RepID=A0A024S801_HYPJR|nr:hypothetical protein M419DRAFT_123695 [Trichoderma reesei RUT C-30]
MELGWLQLSLCLLWYCVIAGLVACVLATTRFSVYEVAIDPGVHLASDRNAVII